ncbi:MAG: hypothetical protein ACFFA0_12225 [Promethearchaeota archaeon]
MKEELTPAKIQQEFLNGDLSTEETADLLISLIDGSENANVRAISINLLEILDFKDEFLFKILENHLISDENAIVRASAAKIIILNYLEEGIKPLEWTTRFDKSPLVMKLIFDIFDKEKISKYKMIEENLRKFLDKFSSHLGVVYEEARFFLDLEAILSENKNNYEINPFDYKFYKELNRFDNSEPWIIINNEHVELLNLNFFNWRYIKDNNEIFNSLSRLKYLDIYLNTIRKYNKYYNDFIEVPESIGRLKSLKKLILKRNNLKAIPESIKNLNSISELDLSHNQFQEIPPVIKSLNSLEQLNMRHNNIHNVPKSMQNFVNSLTEFKI